MIGKSTRSRRFLLAAALALGLAALPTRADDEEDKEKQLPRSDAVYLLDVSGSMRKDAALHRAKTLLSGLLDKVVQPGTKVAVIPFGTGVHKESRFDIPEDEDGAAARRGDMRQSIQGISARDSYTYLFHAIHEGIETLMEFAEKNPGHSRHIVLVSDGKQLTRRGEKRMTLDEIIAHFGELEFQPGEDWFIWYAHIGPPDMSLKRALERTGAGQAIPLDSLSSLNWSYTRFDTSQIFAGRQMPGNWTHRARVEAMTDAAGVGRKVLFKIVHSGLPETMRFKVSPESKELTGETTIFDLEITCEGAQPGTYEDATILVSPDAGSLHWIEPKQMRMSFEIANPTVTVATDSLAFGRVAPGASGTKNLVLAPNGVAAEAKPQVTLEAVDVPEGVTVEFDQATVDIGAETQVAVTVNVPAQAELGAYECRVVLHGGTATVSPAEVKLQYRVGYGHIAVGGDKLLFRRVLTGREVSAELKLTPDEETAAAGARIGLVVTGELPKEIDVELPKEFDLEGLATLPLTVRVPAGVKGGTYRALVHLTGPAGIRIEPNELPLTVTVVEAAALLLPPVVDLGDVPASKAREIEGNFELAVAAHQAGAKLELVPEDGKTVIDPRVVTLQEGRTAVPVRLKTVDVEPGARSTSFHVFFAQEGERSKAGTIAFRWRVHETFFKVKNWAGPSAIPNGTADAGANLVVNSSADLRGRAVRVADLFGGLATGMTVNVTPKEFKLDGGLQTVAVKIHIEGGRTGRYEGSLSLGLARSMDGVAMPDTLPVSLEVAGALVYLTREGGLDGLRHNSDRTVTLVLTAAGVAAPVSLELELDRGGLPESIQVDLPETVTIDRSDGVTRVPVRFRTSDGAPVGSWQPRISVKAKTAGIAVSPEGVMLPADVPDPVTVVKERTFFQGGETATALWAGIAAGVVILIGLAAFMLGRRKTEVVHVQVPVEVPVPVDAGLGDDDLVIEDDEMLVLDGFGDEEDE